MFDPTWFLISRVPGTLVDSELEGSHAKESSSVSTLKQLRDALHDGKSSNDRNSRIFLKPDFLHARHGLIPSSTLLTGTTCDGDEVLLDTFIAHPMASPPRVEKGIRQMACTLPTVDPTRFGLLKCVGVIERSPPANEGVSHQHSNRLITNADFSGSSGEPVLPFDFVFSMPNELSCPKSLRALLVRPGSVRKLTNTTHREACTVCS
jgi:hypothetical protein